MALLSQSGSTPTVPLVASLAEQESRRLSFLPMALIFTPVHLSALAVPASRAMIAKTPITAAATDTFILLPSSSPREERPAFILCARCDRQAERTSPQPPGP